MTDPPLAAARERGHGRVWVVAVVAFGTLAFYLVAYPAFGYRVAIGSDTPVYVWWARRAASLGLAASDTGGRPGFVGAFAVLSAVVRVPEAWLAAAVSPILAATLGLAAGAFAEESIGGDRTRFVLAGFLVGVFVVNLVPGYLSTLAFLALFVAGLACAGRAVGTASSRPVVAAGALFGAAILSHPIFSALGAALLAGAAVAMGRSWRADRAEGRTFAGTAVGRLAVAAVIGAGIGAAGLGTTGGGLRTTVDTSRDAVLARLGLSSLVGRSYRTVLARSFPWWRALPLVVAAALPLWLRPRPWQDPALRAGSAPARLFWGVMAAWLLVTAAGVAALLAGSLIPGQRLAASCLAVPLLAAIGLRGLPARLAASGWGRLPTLLGAVAGALLFAGLLWPVWADNGPLVPPSALDESRTAGKVLAAQSPGTPLILVMDPTSDDPGRLLTRAANYLRGGVPGDRTLDVHVYVGSPTDFLAERPTLTGQLEHDRLSEDAWTGVEPLLPSDRTIAAVLRSFDPEGFAAALNLPEVRFDPSTYRPGPGVVLLPGFSGAGSETESSTAVSAGFSAAGAGPMHPWTPVWVGPALLALLGVVGWPWSIAGTPGGGPLTRAALAPAFGLGAVGIVAVAVDAVGGSLTGGGALLVVALALLAGVAAAVVGARSPGTPSS
jgi:hypothetical protein